MTDYQDYFNYLRGRSRLGLLYRKYWLYPRLNKYLYGDVLDVGCGVGDLLSFRPSTIGVDVNPVIRLNMGNLPIPTSLKNEVDSNTTVSIQPNPSNGEFSLKFKTTERNTYQLNVRNSLGQLVYSETINIQGANTKRFDFSRLNKGVYYISLQNESENIVETVVIH